MRCGRVVDLGALVRLVRPPRRATELRIERHPSHLSVSSLVGRPRNRGSVGPSQCCYVLDLSRGLRWTRTHARLRCCGSAPRVSRESEAPCVRESSSPWVLATSDRSFASEREQRTHRAVCKCLLLASCFARVVPSIECVLVAHNRCACAHVVVALCVRFTCMLLDLVEMRLLERNERALLLCSHALRTSTHTKHRDIRRRIALAGGAD